jgi:hypothetical protein
MFFLHFILLVLFWFTAGYDHSLQLLVHVSLACVEAARVQSVDVTVNWFFNIHVWKLFISTLAEVKFI